MDHGLISQLLTDSEETLSSCTEKMQGPAQYSWSADWSFWVMCCMFLLTCVLFLNVGYVYFNLYVPVYVLALHPWFSCCFVSMN